MKTGFRAFSAPFSASRIAVIDRRESLVVKSGSPLNDRLLYLNRTKHSLVDARNLLDLYHTIFKIAFKNFSVEGKSLVYAVFLVGEGGTIVDFPNEMFQFPGMETPHPFSGKMPDPPTQPELIREAMDSKKIVLHETQSKDFLAVPLLAPKNKDLLGILLFSNKGEEKFTEDISIEVVSAFSEHASEAMEKLMPSTQISDPVEPPHLALTNLQRFFCFVENLRERVEDLRERIKHPYGK